MILNESTWMEIFQYVDYTLGEIIVDRRFCHQTDNKHSMGCAENKTLIYYYYYYLWPQWRQFLLKTCVRTIVLPFSNIAKTVSPIIKV